MLSQREAAAAWGIGRTTIQRAVKSGRLSMTPDKTIDPSEMVRVFGEPPGRNGPPGGPHGPPDGPPKPPETGGGPEAGHHGPWPAIPHDATPVRGAGHPETSQLKAEVEHLKALLAEKDARIADLRQAMTLLAKPSTPAPAQSVWQRLIRRF